MKLTIQSILVTTALLIPIASFATDGDSVSTKVSDSVITTKIKADFAKDKLVSATALKVETDSNGMVEISGTAKSKAEADKAVELAKSVKGVTSVKDKIVISK